MNRYKKYKKINKYKNKKPLLIVFCLAVAIIGIFMYFNNIVNPIILETTKAKTQSLTQMAIQDAVYQSVNSVNLYDKLVVISTDENGKVSYISSNSLQINLLARNLAEVAEQKLIQMGEVGIKIPFGTCTGVPILTGLGPNVKIKLMPIGSIAVGFESGFKNAGINQTNHKIYLNITSNISVIMPTANQKVLIKTQLLVAESIIVGEIPETYLQSNSLENMVDLIPS